MLWFFHVFYFDSLPCTIVTSRPVERNMSFVNPISSPIQNPQALVGFDIPYTKSTVTWSADTSHAVLCERYGKNTALMSIQNPQTDAGFDVPYTESAVPIYADAALAIRGEW